MSDEGKGRSCAEMRLTRQGWRWWATPGSYRKRRAACFWLMWLISEKKEEHFFFDLHIREVGLLFYYIIIAWKLIKVFIIRIPLSVIGT